MHRDLQLSNIMLNKDGYIKIGEFGNGKLIGEEEAYEFVGESYEYMAPEMHK